MEYFMEKFHMHIKSAFGGTMRHRGNAVRSGGCPATVMGTKADKATAGSTAHERASDFAGRPASRTP
jgi:hypothetical protein